MQIENGNMLLKITHYELVRTEDKVRLCVAEVLTGAKTPQFIAYPVNSLGMLAPERFHINDATEQEALQACIRLVEKLPQTEIFPHEEMFPGKKK